MHITLKDVEKKVNSLSGRLTYDKEFIFELLAAYGRAQGNITRLRSGQLNVADDKVNEIAQKGTVYFKPVNVSNDELYAVVDDLKSSTTVVRYSTRFVIATNYTKLLAIDTKTGEPLDINLKEIDKHYTYFLPWAGMEKAQFISENHADVKAAEKMAKLFDTLLNYNGYKSADDWHQLTTFFTRLLFCFFAEDTNIFQKNQFVNATASYTQEDGSDLKDFFKELFASLDREDKNSYPAYLQQFPYVNGRLFKDETTIPEFNKEARSILINSASKLDWSIINPDIFGSMFQAVIRPGKRAGLGQHYTSVPNIMKVIEPLFLNELKEEFDKSFSDSKKLEQLLRRISKIKIFDPACGSGNFLIIAYKELRKLEHAILERQGELSGGTQQILTGSRITIENFYGIEIDDFACEVAILSLWIAKHQMNLEFTAKFGIDLPLIPLKEAGNIVKGNAARVNWKEICPNNGVDEIYLIGNPPYKGGKSISEKSQKEDVSIAFDGRDYSKNVDYISIWFLKGSDYIANSKALLAFVSTNSICQGEQVEMFWPYVFQYNLEIIFAYTSFKWGNRAKGNAGVTCIIVALGTVDTRQEKYVVTAGITAECKHINAYLVPNGPDIIIGKRNNPISIDLPRMSLGSMPKDGGHLILSKNERNNLLRESPSAEQFIKNYVGSSNFISGEERYCLWIKEAQYEQAITIPIIKERLEKVARFRAASDAESTRAFAQRPYRFVQIGYKETDSIIIPRVSSERRSYIPIGYLGKNTVISDLGFAIYDAHPWVFGILTSMMHMTWVRAVSGQLETRIRYSAVIAYNNFPIPHLRDDEKHTLEQNVFAILDARENHPEMSIENMYAPDKMPEDLLIAHQKLDEAVDRIYNKKPFFSDVERLSCLFELYETMTNKE